MLNNIPYEAIERLLEYNWADEEEDYEEHKEDGDNHIFKDMKKIDKWLSSIRGVK